MRALLIVAPAVLIIATVGRAAEIPVYRAEPSGAFLRTWLLCGPFPLGTNEANDDTRHLAGFETDYLQAHGGEQNPQAREGQVVDYPGGSAVWSKHTSDSDTVDLDRALSDKACVLGYAYCEIESPQEEACLLALGSNDGIRVWLNGQQIWDVTRGRRARVDDDIIPIALRRGRNWLLLKVEERGNQWAFCSRLFPLESRRFTTSQIDLFRVVVGEDGSPWLHALPSMTQLSHLIRQARIEVLAAEAPEKVVWQQEWSGERTVPIGVDAETYREYVLRVRATFVGNFERTLEFPFAAGKRVEYTLFDDGKTGYTIVIDREASDSEQWAAAELRHWLGRVSGADFPIRYDSDERRDREIVVGFNDRARALLGPGVPPPDDADESFTYRNVGPSVVIWGGKQRGTMYGVMTFLERELGCRWYSPRVSVAPRKQAFTFHYMWHSESPAIPVRNVFYYEAFDPIWAARNRVNGAMGHREQPGGIDAYWSVHTLVNAFVRPDEFFTDHPEYFAVVDGQRWGGHGAQLCLTNPNVLALVIRQLKEFIRANPEYRIYSVSQNDGWLYCQCASCQALAEREGSQSGPILSFVNQVAAAIEEEFPDKLVGTLAYVYSRQLPKTIRPRHNVLIRLCSFECCRAHDLATCPRNAPFARDLEEWAEIAPHVYIWDYVVAFHHYIMPFPNFKVLQPNIRRFRDKGVTGVMTQAAYQSRGGEFAELRAYVIAKLLWNPDCDVEEVIDDFMSGYYGRSGTYIRRYFDLLHGRVEADTHIMQFGPSDPIFTAEFIREAEALFDKAEVVADNDEIRERVEVARLPIMYLKCQREPVAAKRDGTYARFAAIIEREGITHFSEGGARDRESFHARMNAVR